MTSKIVKKMAATILRTMGYSGYMSELLFNEFKKDILKTKISLKKRLWAYKHGFLSYLISQYGLTEANYKDYESEVHYYKLHPLNEHSKWIDDKMTYKYILKPYSEFLPRYYFEVNNGNVYKLMDCPAGFTSDISSVIGLLQREKNLALKLLESTGGVGFYKLSSEQDKYLVNNVEKDSSNLMKFLLSLDKYVVTEYLISHEFIRKIYSVTPNSLRIMTVHNVNEAPVIVGSFFKFGTSFTGLVDNLAAGGMPCGVDITNGKLYKSKFKKDNDYVDTPAHINTGVKIEGSLLPHWNMIVDKIKDICNYVPQLKYMGFDIIITEDGFKIIEINSHPGIHEMQMYYPLLKNEHVRRLFCKDRLRNK